MEKENEVFSIDEVKKNMTVKQIAFCDYILQGYNQMDSYIMASGGRMTNRNSAKSSGHRYSKNKNVQLYLRLNRLNSLETAIETIDIGKILIEHYKLAVNPSSDNENLKRQAREFFIKAFGLDVDMEAGMRKLAADQYAQLKEFIKSEEGEGPAGPESGSKKEAKKTEITEATKEGD